MSDNSTLYQPLDSSKSKFRLLRVSGFHDGVPDCELVTATLQSDCVHWNALSYQWGDDEATELIRVDHQNFLVRPNLYGFLKRFAEDEDENVTPIFVDAICVNQLDFDERNTQVLLMGEIYKRAAKVIVWIVFDPMNGLTNSMLQELPQLAAKYIERRSKIGANDGRPLKQIRHQRNRVFKLSKAAEASDFLTFEVQQPSSDGDECIIRFEETYSRPKSDGMFAKFESGAAFTNLQTLIDLIIGLNSYWTRLWIIQEILLAKELEYWFLKWKWSERKPSFRNNFLLLADSQQVILVGDYFRLRLLPDVYAIHLDLDNDLQFTVDRFPRQHFQQPEIHRYEAFSRLRANFQAQAKEVNIDFSQAFTISHNAKCGRIEDRVLGMMGITRMHHTPHYGTSQEGLFLDIVANFIAAAQPWEAWLEWTMSIAEDDLDPPLRGQMAAMFAFEMPTAHAWVMLVFSLALDIFDYHTWVATDLTASYEKMQVTEEYNNQRPKHELPKKLYQTRRSALRKLATIRGEKKLRRLMQIKDENGWIWCPLPTPEGGDTRHGEYYSDWVKLIRARIMPVWHYHREQNGEPHEIEPALNPCWTTKGHDPFARSRPEQRTIERHRSQRPVPEIFKEKPRATDEIKKGKRFMNKHENKIKAAGDVIWTILGVWWDVKDAFSDRVAFIGSRLRK